MTLQCTSIRKQSGPNGDKVFFNFCNSGLDLSVEITGTPFEVVYDEPAMTPMVLLAIQAGVFDGEIEEEKNEGDEETFIQSLQKLLLNTN